MNPDFFDFQFYDIPEPQVVSGNINEILVIVEKQDYVLKESLLRKILAAVKLDINSQVTFLQLEEGATINLASIAEDGVQKVFTFGFKPTTLGLNGSFRGYQFYQTASFSILFSHSLKALSEKPAKKKALWTAMQAEFLNK